MINDFEKLREKLHEVIEEYGLNSEEAIYVSNEYNNLVNEYYRKEKQYHEGNHMQTQYIESIQYLKSIAKDYISFPTINEWNEYAKENNLLNSESLKYISGNAWHDLKNRILSEKFS